MQTSSAAPATPDTQSDNKRLASEIASLKQYKGYLEHLSYLVSEGLVMIGADGMISYVNQAFERLTGCSQADMIGSFYGDPRWNFQYDRQPQAGRASVFKTVFDTGLTFADQVCRLERDPNRIFTISATIHHDAEGTMAGIGAIVRDTTEISRVKAENVEIKSVYERLAQYADEAIFRVDAESGRIVYINEAAEKILGYTLADYSTDAPMASKIFTKHHVQSWRRALEKTGAARDVLRNYVLECATRDGRMVIMDFTIIAVRDADERLVCFECLGSDVTVRRFMEAELARSQKLESIGLLAGGVAHDFNNILTAIFGSLALAKMDTTPESPVYMRLTSAEEHCMKAKALTRKLLTYSRGGSPQRKTASIANVIRDAANFALSGKNVACRFDLPEGLWSVQIDEGQMHQVVHALVSNACEAMPQGGTVEVTAENVRMEEGQIVSLCAGQYVRWQVRDHGVGISREHIKKIFDPYFTTKQMSSIKGMGLGLAICYSIVKSHEGTITLDSTPGVGTTFTVYVPAARAEKVESKPVGVVEAPAQPKPKILLIDDEQVLLDVTGSMLRHLGYEVTTTDNHTDALSAYSRAKEMGNPYALIILDLTMRGDEGGEIAIQKWKAAHPEVKAVISSGYMNDPVLEEYWKYGFIGAMVKPYSLMELQTALEKFLANGRQ